MCPASDTSGFLQASTRIGELTDCRGSRFVAAGGAARQLVVRGQWSWPSRPPAGTLWPPPYGRHRDCWVVDYELALHTALSPADAVVVGGGAAPCMPSAAPERGELVSHSATILRGRRFMAPDWGLSRLPSGRLSGIWGLEPVQARRRMLRAHQVDALTRGHATCSSRCWDRDRILVVTDMSGRLVELEDVLCALTEAGPLSIDELAMRLGLNRLDARMVLVDAHAHGLVCTTSRGDWAISDRGREALAMQAARNKRPGLRTDSIVQGPSLALRLRACLKGFPWHRGLRPSHLGPRGAVLALALLVGVGGVAVASGRLEVPAIAPDNAETITKPLVHIRHHHGRARTRTAHRTGAHPHFEGSMFTGTGAVIRHPEGRRVREDRLQLAQCRRRGDTGPAAPATRDGRGTLRTGPRPLAMSRPANTAERRSARRCWPTHRLKRAPSPAPIARKPTRARSHRRRTNPSSYRKQKAASHGSRRQFGVRQRSAV